jgi:dienelactone hydrolase
MGGAVLAITVAMAAGAARAADAVPVTVKDGTTTLKGDLYLPKDAKGDVPLVLVVPEWWGKNDYVAMRASRIADELGYAALAVDMYGDAKVVDNPKDAGELAGPFYKDPEMGLRRLKAFAAAAPEAAKAAKVSVDAKKLGIVGYCFGGTQALNLARSSGTPGATKALAAVGLHAGLGGPLKDEGKISTKVLVLAGAADEMVKPEEIKAFKDEMKKHDAALTYIDYPGAKHAYTNPKATEIGKKFGIPVAYDEKADKASWQEMAAFLKAHLK